MNKAILTMALLALGSAGVHAQDYPTRPVTLIVPFAAGGPADITGRIAADQFSKILGQQFVVENVGGAGGTTGATASPLEALSAPEISACVKGEPTIQPPPWK
jgi:tripartite-type tricarboxylate transporter receptor subunit TctC